MAYGVSEAWAKSTDGLSSLSSFFIFELGVQTEGWILWGSHTLFALRAAQTTWFRFSRILMSHCLYIVYLRSLWTVQQMNLEYIVMETACSAASPGPWHSKHQPSLVFPLQIAAEVFGLFVVIFWYASFLEANLQRQMNCSVCNLASIHESTMIVI